MGVLTVEQYERMNELYEKAVSRYLDKTDFDVTYWLSNEERMFKIILGEK